MMPKMKVYLSNCGFLCIDSGSVPGMTDGDADKTDKCAEEVEIPRIAERVDEVEGIIVRLSEVIEGDGFRFNPGMTVGDDVGVVKVFVGG